MIPFGHICAEIAQSLKTPKSSAAKNLIISHKKSSKKYCQNLPVKSLVRFRGVSKSWRSLIGSKIFIEKHLQNSKRRAIINNYLKQPSATPWCLIDDPANNHLKTGKVVGCYNGLLCIMTKWGRFFLWNPATRISMKLPKLIHSLLIGTYGFGCDEQSGAHKVFACMLVEYNRSGGKVYSSKTNSWKTVDCASLCDCDGIGVFVCGKIHWIPRRGYTYIECFDLKSETFGRMEMPAGYAGWLRESGGRLYVLYYKPSKDVLDLWAMEEYGNQESWVKKSSIPIPLADDDKENFTVINIISMSKASSHQRN